MVLEVYSTPPDALDKRVFDVDAFKKLCPTNDDFWFAGMRMLKNVPVIATDLGMLAEHHFVYGTQTSALRYVNTGQARNDKQLQNLLEYYDLPRKS